MKDYCEVCGSFCLMTSYNNVDWQIVTIAWRESTAPT